MKKINIEIKNINKITVLSIAVIVATLVIGGGFIYKPFLNKNKSLRAEILYARDKNILVGKIKAMGKHMDVYEERIPKNRDVSWLLGELSNLASKEHIYISSIKPGDTKDKGLYIKYNVILKTVSTYHQLGRFISEIESYEKFLRVDYIDIKRADIDRDFDKDMAKFKPFDVNAHIVISMIVLKE